MFGALVFTFLKFSGPPGMGFALTDGWTTTLNIYSQVGLVTLVGLVSKNATLIVEFANGQQEQGRSKIEAVRAAARTRLRPIMMTTAATIAGHFPLTLVTGPGAMARNAIGTPNDPAVISGGPRGPSRSCGGASGADRRVDSTSGRRRRSRRTRRRGVARA
jgi:hypothetical protein